MKTIIDLLCGMIALAVSAVTITAIVSVTVMLLYAYIQGMKSYEGMSARKLANRIKLPKKKNRTIVWKWGVRTVLFTLPTICIRLLGRLLNWFCAKTVAVVTASVQDGNG